MKGEKEGRGWPQPPCLLASPTGGVLNHHTCDPCLGGSSSEQIRWLHPSSTLPPDLVLEPRFARGWFPTRLCSGHPRMQPSEFTGETAQSARWQSFEVMVVTGKATRLQWKIQELAPWSWSAGAGRGKTAAHTCIWPGPHQGPLAPWH